MNCVEVLCDSMTNVVQIENYHQGLIRSNSWCLFRDFHRLSLGKVFLPEVEKFCWWNCLDCLSRLSVAMRHIRIQFEARQNLSNRSLQRSKSQSNLSSIIPEKFLWNEYPSMKKISRPSNSIITTNREIIPLPLNYGLFATFDDFYRPVSSTIKVITKLFMFERRYFVGSISLNVERFRCLNRIWKSLLNRCSTNMESFQSMNKTIVEKLHRISWIFCNVYD